MAAEPDTRSTWEADPALIRFVQIVVDANPRVQAARAALDASDAYRDAAARPLYNPELSLEAENSDTDTRSLGISQTIDWGGKRSARTAVADAERSAVGAEYLLVRRLVTVDLLTALSSHETGKARYVLASERARLMIEFAELAKRRFDAGDLNQIESDLATLASTGARMQKATAATELAESHQAVRNLIVDLPPAQWPTLSTELPGLPGGMSDHQSLVLALPEVQAAQRRIEVASAAVELSKRERRPDPTISLTGGEEDDETLVGLNVSIPLFVRNRFNHEVTAAIAERNQLQQIADDVLIRARARLIGATERYRLTENAWRGWERTGQASVTRQAEQLSRLWEAGEISTTDYIVQLSQRLEVQESALDLWRATWRAWFEWLTASGQVDAWIGHGTTR